MQLGKQKDNTEEKLSKHDGMTRIIKCNQHAAGDDGDDQAKNKASLRHTPDVECVGQALLGADACHDAHCLQRSKQSAFLNVADTILGCKCFHSRLRLAILQHRHVGPKVVLDLVVQVAVHGVDEVVAAGKHSH